MGQEVKIIFFKDIMLMKTTTILSSNFFSCDENLIKPYKNNKLKRLLYKSLVPKKKRISYEQENANILALQTARKWRHLINLYFEGDLQTFEIKAKRNLGTQKIIWQYWGQGVNDQNQPEIVKASFKSVDINKGDYLIVRLDDENIKKYLDIPDFVYEKKGKNNFKHVFFSDLLRLALLDAYGGVWIDATVLLTDKISPDILNCEFFVFQRDANNNQKEIWHEFSPNYFSWDPTHMVNILSSFMVAKKNNEVIHVWLDLLLNYWSTQDSIYHYFFFQILFEELMTNNLYPLRKPIIDDTLPHLLQKELHKPYSPDKYEDIIKQTSIHKLTYVDKRTPNTFYDVLIQMFLRN